MSLSPDLVGKIDPNKLKGAQSPYHLGNYMPTAEITSGSPTHIAHKFVSGLLLPEYYGGFESVESTQIPPFDQTEYRFVLQGKLPTLSTGLMWWKNRVVVLDQLFDRKKASVVYTNHPFHSQNRGVDIIPRNTAPYHIPYIPSHDIAKTSEEPTVLNQIQATPFLFTDGGHISGEDNTRAVVAIRTQPMSGFLDEKIAQISLDAQQDQTNKEALMRELDALQREEARSYFQTQNEIRRLQEIRDTYQPH